MICKNCNLKNDEDAIFCKRCGSSLMLNSDDLERIKEEINRENESNNKTVTKTKTKNKRSNTTKTKYEKEKNRKEKRNKDRDRQIIVTEKTSFTAKVFIFLLIVIIFGLVGIITLFGYKYYENNYNIKGFKNKKSRS